MTEGTTGAKTIWLTLLHVVVGTALLFGTLCPYEFTALLPHAYQFANWPFAFKVAVGVAAAICVIGDVWFFALRPSLEMPQTRHGRRSGGA